MVTDIGPSTVDVDAVRDAVRYPFQRKGFYARGYHWTFYYANNLIYWRKSADGITWGSATDITPSGETPTDGTEIAVWLSRSAEPAQYVHIAYADKNTDSILYYRKGTIAANGTLSWDAVWQTAVALDTGISYSNLTICVDDTNGYPFIGYKRTLRADPSSDSEPNVTHCQTGTGTWATFADFPKVLNTTDDDSWVCTVVPYSGDDIMAVYARDDNNILYDVFDISVDWAGETDTSVTLGDSVKTSVTSQRATAFDAKVVHIAYCDGSDDLQHIRIEAGVVTGPTLIYTSALAMAPSISTRVYGGDTNHYRTLYVFWTPITNEPAADYVCYKKSVDLGETWTKEDGTAGVELWVGETGSGLSGVDIASSYFEEQHHIMLPESYLGIVYTNEGASPDYVRWAGLEFADPDEDLLCKTTIRHSASAELLGNAVIRLVGTPAELLGKFEAQGVANLLGEAIIKNDSSAELLGKAIIKNDSSVELLGKFEAQDIAELLGEAVVRQPASAELFGRFEAQGVANLLGKAIIKNDSSAELLGKVVIRHMGTSAELLGKIEVQQSGSAELLGKFEAQATAELLCKFRTSTDEWVIQGASVEAYIALTIVI